MSPLLLDRPVSTLSSLVDSSWSALVHGESAECPICHGEMQPRYSPGAGFAGGRCSDCGSSLE